MSPREDMDLVLPTTVATAARELMELPSLDPTTTRDLPRKTRAYQDHTVESYAEDASNQESLEHSYWKKSKPSSVPNKQPRND